MSQTSPLHTIVPVISSIFPNPGEMDVLALACLLTQEWVTEDLFGACLDCAMAKSVAGCLQVLGQALGHFSVHDSLIACLWHLQVRSMADAEALSSFLCLPVVKTILEEDTQVQESLFMKLHAWVVKSMKDNSTLDVTTRCLDACELCAQPAQLSTLHHARASATLSQGRLDLALVHINKLLQSISVDQHDPTHGNDRCPMKLSGHLLKLQALCKMGDTEAVTAELSNILQQDRLSTDVLFAIATVLYHDCSCSTVQSMLLQLLAAIAEQKHHIFTCEDGDDRTVSDLEVRIAKSLLLTLALSPDTQDSNVAAAQACQEHAGQNLNWDHLVPQMFETAVKLGTLCERCVSCRESSLGLPSSQQWPNQDLDHVAAHLFNIACQAEHLKHFQDAILLWRSAGALWGNMSRQSLDHLRHSHMAYVRALDSTLKIATTVERHDRGMTELARQLLLRAKEQRCSLQQHMFYVKSKEDHQLFVRGAFCEVWLLLLEADSKVLDAAVDSLIALRPQPKVLWSTAIKLRQGYHSIAVHVLRSALQQALERHENTHEDDPEHIAQIGRALFEDMEADGDRIQTLQLILEVTRTQCMASCYPPLEAHYICATAFNSAIYHMKAKNMPMAQLLMSLACDLADATKCRAVTPDMCRAAAHQFSAASAET
eukprot:jgi/Ulvmu1/8215/UM041_0024.1